MSLSDLRREYMRQGLLESAMADDPIVQFRTWLDEAMAAALPEPNAMTLATSTPDGHPSARMVLLKGVDADGFVFFTNYESRKGRELVIDPLAALVFYWAELERQVRVEGSMEVLPAALSDAYFQSRPRESQLGAWASAQSQIIANREVLEERFQALSAQYQAQPIPRPPYWGGYRVIPAIIEFWQGRPNRLHDRLRYRRVTESQWGMERLSP